MITVNRSTKPKTIRYTFNVKINDLYQHYLYQLMICVIKNSNQIYINAYKTLSFMSTLTFLAEKYLRNNLHNITMGTNIRYRLIISGKIEIFSEQPFDPNHNISIYCLTMILSLNVFCQLMICVNQNP